MDRNFYTIDLNCSKSYETLCNLVNYSCSHQINWYQETGFSYYLKQKKIIYSCDGSDMEKFEEMLEKHGVSFERLNEIKKDYQVYLSTFPQNSICGERIPDKNQEMVFEEEFPRIVEGSNGSQCLTEETITNKDKIRVYIESDEKCKHHIPHAHVDYNHEFNVFSISLIDFSILAGNGKGPKAKKAIELLKNNIDKAKKIWNKCENHSKFDSNDKGELLNTYHFE